MKLWVMLMAASALWSQTLPDPLSLPQALALLDQASPDLQLARLKTLEQSAEARQSSAALGPQLSIVSGAQYQTTYLGSIGLNGLGLSSRLGPYRVLDARPRLTQTVIDLSLLSSVRAARLRSQEAEANQLTVAEQSRLAVIQVYLQALQADARVRAAEARRATADEALRQSQQAFDAGTSNKLEVTRAQQQVERENTTAANAAKDRDTFITVLLRTLGFDALTPVRLQPIQEPGAGSLDGAALLKEALVHRAEVKTLRITHLRLDAEKQSAERERLPKVQAEGDYGVIGQDFTTGVSTWAVGASVVIPLWTSRRIENEVQASELRLQQWQQQQRKLEQQIAQEIAQALVQRQGAQRALDAASRSTAAAKETLALSRQRYGAGLATNLDVVTAQNNLAEAEEEEIRSRYDYWLALAALAYASGDARAFVAPN